MLSEETKITLDLKTIGMILVGVATVVGMWFYYKLILKKQRSYLFHFHRMLLEWNTSLILSTYLILQYDEEQNDIKLI